MLQWKGYEPGFVGAVKVLVPEPAGSSNELPSSEVTVCAVPSWLSTVMVAPGLTESGIWNSKLLIVMVASLLPASEEAEPDDDEDDDELEVESEDDDEPDEPQATRPTAHRPATTSRAEAWVLDMGRSLCERSSEVGDPQRIRFPPSGREREHERAGAPSARRAVAVRCACAALDEGPERAAEQQSAPVDSVPAG